jgi:predicted DCC family thiol-disulfide oxidoreductase YuxK
MERTGTKGAAASTILVYDGVKMLQRSDAVLFIATRLGWPYSLLRAAYVIPRPLRDLAYRVVAASRLKIFGVVEQCSLIDPKHRQRILDTAPEGAPEGR